MNANVTFFCSCPSYKIECISFEIMTSDKNNTQLKWLLFLFTTLFMIFVLNFLEPFHINNPTFDLRFASLLSGYAVTGGLFLLLSEFTIAPLLTKRFPKPWQQFLIEHTWHLVMISLGIWGYSNALHQLFPVYHFPAFSYVEALEKTILVGIIPIGFATMIKYFQLKKQLTYQHDSLIHLQAKGANDWLKIELEQLLFIESSDNYVCVYYLENGQRQRQLLRGSLKHMAEQLQDFPVQRCHHSFIVNLTAVRYADGNARGMKLYLRQWEEPVPVSRKYVRSISESLASLSAPAEFAA